MSGTCNRCQDVSWVCEKHPDRPHALSWQMAASAVRACPVPIASHMRVSGVAAHTRAQVVASPPSILLK
jgi:hypothetical protein